jgi:hypothetical protein
MDSAWRFNFLNFVTKSEQQSVRQLLSSDDLCSKPLSLREMALSYALARPGI